MWCYWFGKKMLEVYIMRSYKMKEKISNIVFEKPSIEIISNVTAQPEYDPLKIKDLLIQQIYSSVRWRESIKNMSETGVHNYIEIGPGKVL